MTAVEPENPFVKLGLDAAGAPLTRREARERANPVPAPEYEAIRTETAAPPILSELRPTSDYPRRSAIAEKRTKPGKAARPGKPAKPAKAAKAPRPGKGPKNRRVKVKVRFAKAPKNRASIGSKFLSLGALLGAAALLVGMSVPANAFMNAGGGDALATATMQSVPGQSLKVPADAANAAPSRDSFEVISYAEVLALKYSGVSYAYTATTGAVRWPFPYAVATTDGFGIRNGDEMHNGVDFVPGNGTPIYAIADGIVTTATELEYSFGNHVILQHNLAGVNVQSLYAHMQSGSSPLQVGQEVKVGDFIGLVGETGRAYGAHLHFEIHIDGVPVDPYAWLEANAV